MTLSDIPTLTHFTRGYWNQLGADVYGSIEAAFSQMLSDASRSDDGGTEFRLNVRRELMSIYNSTEYEAWLKEARCDPAIIREAGGRFVLSHHVEILLKNLEEGNVSN